MILSASTEEQSTEAQSAEEHQCQGGQPPTFHVLLSNQRGLPVERIQQNPWGLAGVFRFPGRQLMVKGKKRRQGTSQSNSTWSNSTAWRPRRNSRWSTNPADFRVFEVFFLFVKPVTCRTRNKGAFALQFSGVPLTLLSSFEVAIRWSKPLIHSHDFTVTMTIIGR